MKHQKSVLLFALLLVSMLLLHVNCDKDKNPTEPTEESLVGTWELTKITIVTDETTVLTDEILTQMGAYWTLKLKSDQTFESNYNLEEQEDETGTWSKSDNNLKVTFDSGGSDTYEYSLNNNVLTLEWTDVEDGVQENLIGEFSKQ